MAQTESESNRPSLFPATRWSVVVMALDAESPAAASALEQLCSAYWYPLYVYIRRCGRSPDDARDLTQEFFARLLEKNYLHAVDRGKGRLRTFLVVLLKRFLANEWDRETRQKRGGGLTPVPFDTQLAERRFAAESTAVMEADAAYDRRWALTLLERSIERLSAEYGASGRSTEFAALKSCLAAERSGVDYPSLAQGLAMNEGAVRTAVHRLRRRFREIFREEIGHTVSVPEEIEVEVRHLVEILGRTL